ncbi:HNH endonuclease [Metabacillus indicus]|uniref:HNH endonuclease n=1 Tax=Metabacillus indicus TaxID=246786 RepID=UPI002A04DC6D|nr:HNH endonuclease [Metabacillus indicus]MDX8291429.1 HNH endonuclease [Metabacillus indicus]
MIFYKSALWKEKRKKILKRDEFLCQECKKYGKTTEATTVHHINPLLEKPEFRLTNWNLISFCTHCHDKMHDRVTDKLTELGEWWRDRALRNQSF